MAQRAVGAACRRDGPTVEQERVFMRRMGREGRLCHCCGGVDTHGLLASMASRERVPPPPSMPTYPDTDARPAPSDDSTAGGGADGYVTAADSAESWRSAGDSGSNDTVLSAAAAPSELALDKYLKDEMVTCNKGDMSDKVKKHNAAARRPSAMSAASSGAGPLSVRTASSAAVASGVSSCDTVVYVSSTDRDALRRQAHMTGMRLRARVDGDGLPNVIVALPPPQHTASAEQQRSEWWSWPEPPRAARAVSSAAAPAVSAHGADSVRSVVGATSSGKSIGMARRSPLQKLLATDFYKQLIAASDTAGGKPAAVDAKPSESRCSSTGGGDADCKEDDSEASEAAQVTAVLRAQHTPPPPVPAKRPAVGNVPPLGTGRVRALVRYFEREISRIGAFARRHGRRNKTSNGSALPPRAAIAGR